MLAQITRESLSKVLYSYPPHAKDAGDGYLMTFVVDGKKMQCVGYLPDSNPDLGSAMDAAIRFKKHEPSYVAVVVRKPQTIVSAYSEGLRVL